MVSEIKNVWNDFVGLLCSQVLSLPLAVFYISMIARNLGPQQWGALTLAMAACQLLYAAFISWTASSIVRFGKEELLQKGNLRNTVNARMSIMITTFIFALFLLLINKEKIIVITGLPEKTLFSLLIMFIAYSISDHYSWILKACGRMKHFALSTLVRQGTLFFILIIYFISSFKLSVNRVILMEILAYVSVIIFSSFFIKFKSIYPCVTSREYIRSILKYSYPMIAVFLLGYAVNWMDVFFIKHYLSITHVGVYQTAYRLLEYIRTPLYGIPIIAFPALMAVKSRGKSDIIKFYVQKIIPQLASLWLCLIIIAIGISREIIFGIFGKPYFDAAWPFAILLSGLAFQIIALMYTSIFAVSDLLYINTIAILIGCIINALGDILLIPYLGINGAAIATSISCLAIALTYIISGTVTLGIKNSIRSLPFMVTIITLSVLSSRLSFIARVASEGALLSLCFYSIKRSNIFNGGDLADMEKIAMPLIIRRGIKYLYVCLAPPGRSHESNIE